MMIALFQLKYFRGNVSRRDLAEQLRQSGAIERVSVTWRDAARTVRTLHATATRAYAAHANMTWPGPGAMRWLPDVRALFYVDTMTDNVARIHAAAPVAAQAYAEWRATLPPHHAQHLPEPSAVAHVHADFRLLPVPEHGAWRQWRSDALDAAAAEWRAQCEAALAELAEARAGRRAASVVRRLAERAEDTPATMPFAGLLATLARLIEQPDGAADDGAAKTTSPVLRDAIARARAALAGEATP